MSAKDQQEFGLNVEKRLECLAAPERNKARKLQKRYACAFATNNKSQDRGIIVKYKIDTDEARSIVTGTQKQTAGEA